MKTILITGANAGIGLAAAVALSDQFHIIALCRSKEKGEAAMAEVRKANPKASTELVVADLANFEEVKRAADQVLAKHTQLDVLLNNAGYLPETVTYTQGVESTIFSSHLGHMLLTLKLMPLLEASGEGRVVNVSSEAHLMGKKERLYSETKHTSTIKAYGDAKFANVLFTKALVGRYKGVTAYALHPGVVRTQFARNIKGFMKFMVGIMDKIMFITPEQGAQTSVYLSRAPFSALSAHNGAYFVKSKPSARVNKEATIENANWFWEKSLPFVQPFLN